MVEYFPIVKLNQPSIMGVYKGLPIKCIVVRLQDLISPYTSKPNKIFYKIKTAGGIHNFLSFNGTIILSLIMKDKHIFNFNSKKYCEIIDGLKPDFYTTVDGETYQNEEDTSLEEIKRSFIETNEIIKNNSYSKPIGLIKGCNKRQILAHIKLFKLIGVNDFIFHVGDFFREGKEDMITLAKNYSSLIKKHANTLILYGMGSQKRILEFSFADGYVSFNFLVKALKGKKYDGTKLIEYKQKEKKFSYDTVKHNLKEMLKNIENVNNQEKLIEGGKCKWVVDQEEREFVTLKAETQIQEKKKKSKKN
jgi:hypothetical protein